MKSYNNRTPISEGNRFAEILKEKVNELIKVHTTSDGIIEMIAKYIAISIVIVIMAVLTPTIGIIMTLYVIFRNMTLRTYQKLSNESSSESKFPIMIELSIYSLLTLPFLIILIPYWIVAYLFIWSSEHILIAIIIAVVIVGLFFALKKPITTIMDSFFTHNNDTTIIKNDSLINNSLDSIQVKQ